MRKNAPRQRTFLQKLLAFAGLTAVIEILIWFRIFNDFWATNIILICIYIILAVSLNLINGFTGQFSLGHAGFMAVGGYTAAIIGLKLAPPLIESGIIPSLSDAQLHLGNLPTMYIPLSKVLPGGIVLLASLLLGGTLAALMGFVIGLPTLRLRGDYLAIATLGFGEIIRLTFQNIEYLGGATGLPQIPQYATVFYSLAAAVMTVLLIGNIIRSTHGRAMMSVREDEIAAETMGVNSTRYKVTAFIIGAFFAGVAGALFAHTYFLVNPKMFSLMKTIDILVMVVLGGQGSIAGSVAGAILITLLNAFLSNFPYLRMVIFALFLIGLMIFMPKGLLTFKELFITWRPKKAGDAAHAAQNG